MISNCSLLLADLHVFWPELCSEST